MSAPDDGARLSADLAAAAETLLEKVARRIVALHGELLPAPAAEARSPWMGVEQAAQYLDWPRQRLYKLTAAGAIPHYKHDGRLLFRRDELDRWLAGFAEGPERDWMNRP